MSPFRLVDFVVESNRIEGITRNPTSEELAAHEAFLDGTGPTVARLENFVASIAPGKRLRRSEGMDVYVGNHHPPRGGPAIEVELRRLLGDMRLLKPYHLHRKYEALHPFMDGNGRSGRVLWLWMMGGIERVPLGFLHTWYYQSLEAGR